MTDKKAADMTKQECIAEAMACIDAAERAMTHNEAAALATQATAYLLLAQVKSE